MKKLFSIVMMVSVVATVFAAKGLVLTQKYVAAGNAQNVTVTWYITEGHCKLKMQFSNADVSTTSYYIPDLKAGKLLSYGDGALPQGVQKTYFAIPVQNIKGDAGQATVQRSGETKEISGMLCEKVTVKMGWNVTEMWVTKTFDVNFAQFAPFFKSSNELKALSDGFLKGVPVTSNTKDGSGNAISSYELISVAQQEIPDSEFAVPSDYKSVEEVSKAKK